MLQNVPEVLLKSQVTKPGQIEYRYTIAGGVTTSLFIEVKLRHGNPPERLDLYAQVIAESIGMSLSLPSLSFRETRTPFNDSLY